MLVFTNTLHPLLAHSKLEDTRLRFQSEIYNFKNLEYEKLKYDMCLRKKMLNGKAHTTGGFEGLQYANAGTHHLICDEVISTQVIGLTQD